LRALFNASNWKHALGLVAGLGLAFGALVAVARGLVFAARRSLRPAWPYVLRQGVSNLYRPHNQTLLFLLSLGLGTFRLLTILLTRNLLLQRLTLARFAESPNVYLVDVQPDQVADVTGAGDTVIVRRAGEVAATPAAYRDYVQRSRGEISCAKPSCMRLQNAWISDRTLCYLASGRPAVVQDTGPSPCLDGRDGLLRFSSLDGAAASIARIEADYERHRVAARELAQTLFDARDIAERMLTVALSPSGAATASARRPATAPRTR